MGDFRCFRRIDQGAVPRLVHGFRSVSTSTQQGMSRSKNRVPSLAGPGQRRRVNEVPRLDFRAQALQLVPFIGDSRQLAYLPPLKR